MEVVFTDRELDLMDVLWDCGSATVAEVVERLDSDPAYTTISTLLRILVEKGHVEARTEGRAHRYYPLVGRAEAGSSALKRLTRKIFQGSPEAALTYLVSDSSLSKVQIQRLQALLKERLGEGQE